ncbi:MULTISPECIES: acyl-CoA carboxylase subunit epsilon [Actinopolyspora]|uniref:Acyl-CoA carboxylase epsilon subunit n=1 Tax=Actinopolyspora saharensis TaxID=995062 RepID=A0A1H1EDK3_9ACTN|nr:MULTISPECIES: acyl-CoA carboxylase subunit epsilon [Actinopolyspora]NHD19046.1 acyl-CoA carboxylase subunit epsilon [Actinopolyspora sp. BKK2]NHE78169.1 acyl-CoA carboxylase subunit epsilon [Actinopolyspora sp. BKK1]SDQ86783.1 Acyl-CoA carboxylase epsilon subunit [Actinopolyspora saharensis]
MQDDSGAEHEAADCAAPAETDAQPLLRVERGNPDEAEIAALTAALVGLAKSAPASPERPARMSMWADRAAALRYPGGRRPLRPGPNAWRASALPM